MHRQSLGSSGSKLQTHHDGKEEKPITEPHQETVEQEQEHDKKGEKIIRSTFRTEKLVHLIPVLLFFCLFVLYLFSHDPSQKDLIKITGSGRFFRSKEMVDLRKKRGAISTATVLYSHRSLQQIKKSNRKSRSDYKNRKFGDF